MASKQYTTRLNFHKAATYRIKVLGHLYASWSPRLEGVNITHVTGPDGEIETLLMGRLGDQAALSGVLNTLYDLRFPVIAVDCLDCS